jgi:hypothetical protein
MTGLSLKVVDRHMEMERLIRTAERNHERVAGKLLLDKPYLLYSSQVFGSGKTTFRMVATTLVGDTVVASRLLNPPTNDTVSHDLADMRRTQQFTPSILASYANAKTVFVDLKHIPLPTETPFTFREALYCAFFNAATGSDVSVLQFRKDLQQLAAGALVQMLVERTGHKGKWFFFVDEIGYIERYMKYQRPRVYSRAPHHKSQQCSRWV